MPIKLFTLFCSIAYKLMAYVLATLKQQSHMSETNENKILDSNPESQQRKLTNKNPSEEGNSCDGTQSLNESRQSSQNQGENVAQHFQENTDNLLAKIEQKGSKIIKNSIIHQPEQINVEIKEISQKSDQQKQSTQQIQNDKKQQKQIFPKSEQIQSQNAIKNQIFPLRPIHIVAVSDNHGDYKMMNQILQLKGDIFIHAGDFTYQGKDQDFQKFFSFLDNLKFRHKIVISGNHQNVLSKFKLKTVTKMTRQKVLAQLKKRCIYLQHEAIEIQGVKIFASPYTPQYCQKPTSRAFQYKPSHENIIWNNIPKDIHLLITHGPPFGILDSGKNGKRAGSEGLKLAVQMVKPKYHIFGHIHESKGGMTKISGTTYINLCNTPTRFIIEP